MSSDLCDDKKAFTEELDNFLITTKNVIGNFIEKIGWTEEYLSQQPKVMMVPCPFNAGHIVPTTSLEKHKEYCSWRQEGYSKEEVEHALPSSHFFYKNSNLVVPVLIDKALQTKILKDAAEKLGNTSILQTVEKNVPRTMERAMSELTPSERLAIYEYVIEKAKEINRESVVKVEDLQFNLETRTESEQNKPKSHLELMAEQRDYKRRRQSYRAKNVHITKKSYTEIMRELIQNQMEVMEEEVKCYIKEEPKEEVKEEYDTKPNIHNRHWTSSRRSSYHSNDLQENISSSSSSHRNHKRERSRSKEREYKRHHHHHHKHHKHKKSRHHKHKYSDVD